MILYISRAVNYSYEFHFDQNRGLPRLETSSQYLLGHIKLHYIPKRSARLHPLFGTAAQTCSLVTREEHGLWTQTCQGGFPCVMAYVCVQHQGLFNKEVVSEWQPQEILSGLIFGELWRSSMISYVHQPLVYGRWNWAFKNYSIIFLCKSMFRIKHQNVMFYNYTGLWSCHHHVKTFKKLEFGFY